MSTLSRSEDKIRLEDLQHYDQDDIGYCSLERPDSPTLRSHHGSMEQEKRIRREIANSNERRRMQSINAGFQSLRTLLPHHEGEKLSKAAILQQTAEYIYQLEQEKTRLLSQNCQLKRLINQHEGETTSAAKKRKTESGLVVSVTDEIVTSAGAVTGAGAVGGAGSPTLLDMEQAGVNSELIDLRVQLDRERGLRMILEDQVRSLETQLYPERIREITQQVQLQFSQQQQEDEPLPAGLLTPVRRESQSSSGSESAGQEAASAVATLQVVSAASLQPVSHTETVIATTPSPPTSPSPASASATVPTPPSRLPSILEAAIKAEPKVEVERLPSPNGANGEEVVPQARVYLASTSRQNLETIVEAIRHLEGDAFISDSATESTATVSATVSATTGTTQESPLALTKQQRLLKVEMNPFLQFHSHPHPQQQRPGVIVVKQHT